MFLKKLNRLFSAQSIRVRLSLLFVLIFGVCTLLFNIFIYQFMVETLQQDFDDALFNYSVDISDGIVVERGGDYNIPPLHLDHGKILPFRLGTALILIRHSSGKVLEHVGQFGDFDPPYKESLKKIRAGAEADYRTITEVDGIPSAEAMSYRLISVPLDEHKRTKLLLQIAVPMTLLETQISRQLKILQMGIPIVLIAAALGGIFLSARALRPLQNMIQITKEIKASDFSKRVPIPTAHDEIKTLSLTFNEMLERIEQSFQSQERFVADASHQLMTPLAVMRGELELKTKSEDIGIQELSQSLLQEVGQLSKIVQEMLLLSRIDSGTGSLKLESLRLDELIFEVLPRLEKFALNKQLKIIVNLINDENIESPLISGDQDLLQHLFINIIENAIKYSQASSTVHIDIGWNTLRSYVVVRDQAGGIPENQLPYIFDRFSRGPKVENTIKGHGIGLAIAKKVAELHDASIVVSNEGGGACFKVEIKNI